MEYAYLFDEDGTQVSINLFEFFVTTLLSLQMYCTLCSGGNEVFMCDTPNCSK